MSRTNCILLSIRSEHAKRIYSGQKPVELRKSFPRAAKLVFLYETSPSSAVTGAFTVREAIRTTTKQAISLAAKAGIERNRAIAYYRDQRSVWVVRIGAVVRFRNPLSLKRLRQSDYDFMVPQSFRYLDKQGPIFHDLMFALVKEAGEHIALKPIAPERLGEFECLVREEVGSAYENIDDDFIKQVLNNDVSSEAAFSTRSKHILEVAWDSQVVGFTVLTEKTYGAWKSGPTILRSEFRGLGLGQALRRAITDYCNRRKAIGIYCTCASSRPAVVSYLLNSHMDFQARLREHLARDRDEFVFAQKLRPAPHRTFRRLPLPATTPRGNVVRVDGGSVRLVEVLEFFLRWMKVWYFKPADGLREAVVTSIRSYDRGVRRYSAKGRLLYAFVDKDAAIRAAALVTIKRSGMAKINLVADSASPAVNVRLLGRILRDAASVRRMYITVPLDCDSSVAALIQSGFSLEGILLDPFGTGVDHACFGLVRRRGRRKK